MSHIDGFLIPVATPSFGMLTDKFGVPWMVNVAEPRA